MLQHSNFSSSARICTLNNVLGVPSGFELYAGAELFSKSHFVLFFQTKLFCFFFILGGNLSNSAYISTVTMRLRAG